MRNIFFFFCLVIIFPVKAQYWNWAIKFENLKEIKTALTDDGSAYAVGSFMDSCQVDGHIVYGAAAPNFSSIMMKFSADGKLLWYKLNNGRCNINALSTDGDEIFIAGQISGTTTGLINDSMPPPPNNNYYQSNIYIARISPDGDLLAYKREGGLKSQELRDLYARNGKIYMLAYFYDTAIVSGNTMIGNKYQNIFWARYDQQLNLEIVKKISGKGYYDVTGFRIRADERSNIYLHVYLGDTISYGENDTIMYFAANMETEYLVLDEQGKIRNVVSHVSDYFPHIRNFFPVSSGADNYTLNFLDDGSCNHCCSGIILDRADQTGNWSWHHNYGGDGVYEQDPRCVEAGDMAVTGSGIAITGYFTGNFSMGNDSLYDKGMYLSWLDHKGDFSYTLKVHAALYPKLISNVVNDQMLISGAFLGDAWLGDNFLQGGSSVSSFIAKYSHGTAAGIANETKADSKFRIYPNPSTGEVHFADLKAGSNLRIYNLTGEIVKEWPVTEKKMTVQLPAGMYIYTVVTPEKVYSGKILIQ